MNILVTAGNTLVPIDRVRCITNVFTGRTGAWLALHFQEHGHTVTLLTSHPETMDELRRGESAPPVGGLTVHRYRTFEDLERLMATTVRNGSLDAVVHAAAVSDYAAAGIYAPAPGTQFDPDVGRWTGAGTAAPVLVDRAAGKVKSDEPELWLRLVRTPKLIDRVRTDWRFAGVLVKFKLETGVSDEQLLETAERSRRHSAADLIVANTLEGAHAWAYVGPVEGGYQRVSRRELPARLLELVERLHGERGHG
jgi:phosphopantothenoylcysteine synthetase/decarboxylase